MGIERVDPVHKHEIKGERVRAESKTNIAIVPALIVGFAVTVAVVWWAYGKWGLPGAIVAFLIVPETLGYWSYMLSALLFRGLLAVFPTSPDPTLAERMNRPPEVATTAVDVMPILMADDFRGPGVLSEHADGSWLFALANGQVLVLDRPLDSVTGYRRSADGGILLNTSAGLMSMFRLRPPVEMWLANSNVMAQIPEEEPTSSS